MRSLVLLLLVALTVTTASADVDIIRAWPRYRAAESFTGIGEYFGRPEATRGRLVLRSQPEERGGYYWLVRVRNDAPVAAVLVLEVLRAGAIEAEVHRFPCDLPAGRPVLLAGLTGKDWPEPEARPTAWRIQLLDAKARVLADTQSFLWARPEPKPENASGS